MTTDEQLLELEAEAANLRALAVRLVAALTSIQDELTGPHRNKLSARRLIAVIIERAQTEAARIMKADAKRPPSWYFPMASAEMYTALETFEGILDGSRRTPHDIFHIWLNAPNRPEVTPETLLRDALAIARRGGRPQPSTTNDERNA